MAKLNKTKLGGIERVHPKKIKEIKETGKELLESVNLEPAETQGHAVGEGGTGQVVIVTPQRSAVYDVKSETLKKIETILEEGLEEIFYTLTPAQQTMIKREGEHTARLIEEVIIEAKITAVKIFNLIRHWLEFIPGVNKLFLEQEAKIKTDKILKMQKS